MAGSCLLYYITDRTAFASDEPTRRRCVLEKIAEAAAAGVDYIQLREKDLPARELESLAREAAAIVRRARAENRELRTALLINSRTDIALAVGAHGVHLRAEDVSPKQVRSIWQSCDGGALARDNPQSIPVIAASCHSPEETNQAGAQGATFAVFGPVFEKNDAPNMSPAGLDLLAQASKVKIPVLALGGVTLQNASSCLEAGAAGLAAIRLFQENDAAKIVTALRR